MRNALIWWIITIIVLVGSPIWLAIKPTDFTPVVAILLNAILFVAARLLGQDQAEKHGFKIANDRWLPQAESAMHRLLTVLSSIRSFKSELSSTCNCAAKEHPELKNDTNKTLKTVFSAFCQHGAKRLGDIINHLEDSLGDWNRFVQANCQGEECARIFRAMKQKKDQLENQLKNECKNDMGNKDNGE